MRGGTALFTDGDGRLDNRYAQSGGDSRTCAVLRSRTAFGVLGAAAAFFIVVELITLIGRLPPPAGFPLPIDITTAGF